MTKQKATREKVFAAADSIAAEGETPTYEEVRARVGGGSMSTISPFLNEWIEAQAKAPDLPPDVQQQMLRFAHGLWASATVQANERVKQAEALAHQLVAKARESLKAALDENRQMEQERDAAEARLEPLQRTLIDTEVRLAKAEATAARVPELEVAVRQAVAELSKIASEAAAHRLEATIAATEVSVLREQLSELRKALALAPQPTSKARAQARSAKKKAGGQRRPDRA